MTTSYLVFGGPNDGQVVAMLHGRRAMLPRPFAAQPPGYVTDAEPLPRGDAYTLYRELEMSLQGQGDFSLPAKILVPEKWDDQRLAAELRRRREQIELDCARHRNAPQPIFVLRW